MEVLDILSSEETCSKLLKGDPVERRHPLPQMRLNTAEGAWKLWRGSQKVQVQNVWENLQRQDRNPIPLFSAKALREWFTLILLFLALHNSTFSLSWLLGQKLHDHL